MKRHICTSCDTEIERGQAVLRSIDFQVVAWCRGCAAVELHTEGAVA